MYTHHRFGKGTINKRIGFHLLLIKQIKNVFVAWLAVADQRGDCEHLGEADHLNTDHLNTDHTMNV
jgi:hypothetical protein